MLNISQDIKNALLAPSRYIKFKIEVYFDGINNEPTDITSDVIDFDTSEEVSSSTLPFSGVSYNELVINLNNMDKRYTISNVDSQYNDKLVAKVPVVLTYLVDVHGEFKTIKGGVFYTDAWASDNEALTASVTCYDKLFMYGSNIVKRFKVKLDYPVVEAYKLLFKNSGVDSSNYSIDSSILDTIDIFWCQGDTLASCLDTLSLQTKTNVFVSKDDIIYVKPLTSMSDANLSITDSNLILTSKSSPSYSNIYSAANIKYNSVIEPNTQVLYSGKGTLAAGINSLKEVLFSNSPVVKIDNIMLNATTGAYIKTYGYNDKYMWVDIMNTSDSDIEYELVVEGRALSTVETSFYIDRQTGTANTLDLSLPYTCTKEYAMEYANVVLNMFSSYTPTVTLNIRGFPPLELFDVIRVSSPTSVVDSLFHVMQIDNSFIDGMSSTITVRVTQEVPK